MKLVLKPRITEQLMALISNLKYGEEVDYIELSKKEFDLLIFESQTIDFDEQNRTFQGYVIKVIS